MNGYQPQKVVIEEAVKESLFTLNLLRKVNQNTRIEYVSDASLILKDKRVSSGKETILLVRNRGRFVKPCPGTKKYLCCGYYILNLALNCPLSCSYCILQSYLNIPYFTIYANIEDLFSELKGFFGKNGSQLYRIGTGEFTDSLLLDSLIDYVEFVAPLFSSSLNAYLELKTKTVAIENLEKVKNRERIIVSWSLNTPRIIESEESWAASLDKRIEAARFCEKMGYRLGFHFDPLISYPGCEKEYSEVIKNLFSKVKKESIVWISLGTLRFQPSLKKIVESRFPNTGLFYEEFIIGLDGKMRYFKPIRINIYRRVIEEIRKYDPECFIYLCMESRDVWVKSLGFFPSSDAELREWLDKRLK